MAKILVIEDEEYIRENIQDILSLEHFETLTAANGAIGLELARQETPDLIVCDIMMPEMDGYGVLERLRKTENTATIPVIFLTAKADRSNQRRGMELGASDYLTKPFTPSELLKAISTQLEKQAAVERKAQIWMDELRSNITSALPHELHTPLTGIIGISDLLITDYGLMETAEILDMLKDINQSGKRLYRLTQNFLLYAELELQMADPGRRETHHTPAKSHIKGLIQDVALQIAQQNDRESDLNLNLEDTTLLISEPRLRKILEELLDNAFKFSDPQTPVALTGTRINTDYCLSITNQGRGMTPDQIARLGAYMQFERRLYEQQGSGLGLIIAKRLTEIYGGRMQIDSQPGELTEVQIFLPCQTS